MHADFQLFFRSDFQLFSVSICHIRNHKIQIKMLLSLKGTHISKYQTHNVQK
jgi:hypothetical protein